MSELLKPFGFNKLEEDVYAVLLRYPSITGYRAAQLAKRAVANTYKALEALVDKGAVMIEDGDPATYCAVPIRELFGQLEARFRAQQRLAIAQFRSPRTTSDHRVYRLGSRQQTLQRAASLIAGAKDVLLLDLFPTVLNELRNELSGAAERGVSILGKVYTPTSFPGAKFSLDPDADLVLNRWPAEWLILLADGRELLLGLVDRSGKKVHHAIWTKNPFITFAMLSSQFAEILLAEIETRIESGADGTALSKILKSYKRVLSRGRLAEGYQRVIADISRDD